MLNHRGGRIPVFVLLFTLCLAAFAGAEETPFAPLVERTLSFFRPLSADVVSFEDGSLRINAGSERGVVKGMRLVVLRKGEYFYHPVTRERLGRFERPIGLMEVVEVDEGGSTGRLIQGEAEKGDLVRMSATRRRLLFYQDDRVDYYLADAYYRELKGSGRFDIVDAPNKAMGRERLLQLAASEKAEVILVLTSETKDGKRHLRQTLLWDDGTVLAEDSVEIPEGFLKGLRFGSELLLAVENEPLLSYDLSYGAELLGAGDVNGDGRPELVMSSGMDIRIYSYEGGLGLLHKIDVGGDERIVWMDLHDLDGDGREEIFLTAITSDHERVNSYVYRLEGGRLLPLWKTEGFVRVLDGRVLYQGYSTVEGYSGPLLELEYDGGFRKAGRAVPLEGINIYDFVSFKDREGRRLYLYINEENQLVLLNTEGLPIWRSPDDMGGFVKEFAREAPTIMVDRGNWHIPDRMVINNNEAMVVKREPLVEQATTIGYKSSELHAYWYNGMGMEDSVLIDDIPGELLDYSVHGDRIVVLSRPLLGIKAENILKGENPFVTLLRIYSLRGR